MFRLRNGLGESVAGERAKVTASGAVRLVAEAGETAQIFTLSGSGPTGPGIEIVAVSGGGDFVGSGWSMATLTALVLDAAHQPVDNAQVTWEVVSAANRSPAMYAGYESKKTGLTWGTAPESGLGYTELGQERIQSVNVRTNGEGRVEQRRTDIVGERTVTVRASVEVEGQTYTTEREVRFGNGPLSVFARPEYGTVRNWYGVYEYCNGGAYLGDTGTWNQGDWVGGNKMPSVAEMQAVSMPSTYNEVAYAQGAAFAAGWSYGVFWTGDAYGAYNAYFVLLNDGDDGGYDVNGIGTGWAVCRR